VTAVPPTAAPAAVFFDVDGTLIETEHLYAIAGSELVIAAGHPWTQAHVDAAVGTALDDFAVQLQDAGVRKQEEEIIGHVVDRVNTLITTEDVWREGGRGTSAVRCCFGRAVRIGHDGLPRNSRPSAGPCWDPEFPGDRHR
jgi:hypothetical protein